MKVNLSVTSAGHAVRVSADVPKCRLPLIRGFIRDAVKFEHNAPEMMGRIVRQLGYTDRFTLHDTLDHHDYVVDIELDDKQVYDSEYDYYILFADIDAWSRDDS